MLAHPFLIESICHTWQLDLTMKRFVRRTEQCPIGNAVAIAIGRHGRRFHINGNSTGLVQALGDLLKAQFPVTVAGGHHRAGAQMLLEL